jgi:hypothetical protein
MGGLEQNPKLVGKRQIRILAPAGIHSMLDVRCSMFDVYFPGFSRVRRSLLRGSQGGTGILPSPFGVE